MNRFEVTFVPRGHASTDDSKKLRRLVEAPDRDAAFRAFVAAYPGATVERIEEVTPGVVEPGRPEAQDEFAPASTIDGPVLRTAEKIVDVRPAIIKRTGIVALLACCIGLLLLRLAFGSLTQPHRPDWDRPTRFGAGPAATAHEPTPFVTVGHTLLTIAAMLCLALGATQALRRVGIPRVAALPVGLLPLIVTAMTYAIWETNVSMSDTDLI